MSLVPIAYASSHIPTAQGFLASINSAILFPLITLMMAAALLIFLWGAFEYVKNSASEQGREQGRQHLIWGVIGMLVMLSAYAILTIAAGTFGLEDDLERVNTPTASGGRGPTGTGGLGDTTGSGFVEIGTGGGTEVGTDGGTGLGTNGGTSFGAQ